MEALRQRNEAGRQLERCREAYKRQLVLLREAERRVAEVLEKLASRPVQVIHPPNTADIIKETVTGVATILNGWRDNPASQGSMQAPLSMDGQGLTADAGIGSVDDFIPPWEQMARIPGNINDNADYPPYVPGGGNPVPPPGGIE